MNALLVGAGGFVGSVCRYLLGNWVQRMVDAQNLPVGTLAVNVIGCLTIGLLSGFAESRGLLSPEVRLFLVVGLLGGFTTFSAFGNDTFLLWRDVTVIAALLNIALHVMLGLGAVWLGHSLVRMT